MKKRLKQILYAALLATGVVAACRRRTGRSLRILSYHGVVADGDNPDWNADGFFVAENVFARHLDVLRTYCHPVSLDDLDFEKGNWPDYAVAVTFDDGYRNNLTQAAPLLLRNKIPATFFIATGFADNLLTPWWIELRQHLAHHAAPAANLRREIAQLEAELRNLPETMRLAKLRQSGILSTQALPACAQMASWEDLRQLCGLDFALGSHGVRHLSAGHDHERFAEEIAESISRLKTVANRPIAGFSYPYGTSEHLAPLSDCMKSNGLRYAVTEIQGINEPNCHPFGLKRISLTGNHTALDLTIALFLASAIQRIPRKPSIQRSIQ